MVTHDLKTHKTHFTAVWNGDKTAEIRLNDRDLKEGDFLVLRETTACYYTGRYLSARITHVLENFVGIADGFCMLSLAVRTKETAGHLRRRIPNT